MKYYKEGQHSKAICDHCEKLVSTTFQHRSIPLNDGIHGTKTIHNILVAVCNQCDSVVAIPAQSTKEIKRQKELT